MTDAHLVETFVGTFHVLDDLMLSRGEHHSGDINSLLVTPWDHDLSEWRPRPIQSLSAGLGDLYREIGGAMPPLFEQLVLSFAWAQVDLGRVRLIENLPPIPESLSRAIREDRTLFSTLSKNSFAQFGRAPEMNYDPVCFDLSRRDAKGDCPVVRFDHEAILNHNKLVRVAEIAPSFERLIELIIADSRRRAG
jgi:hypothetical protein